MLTMVDDLATLLEARRAQERSPAWTFYRGRTRTRHFTWSMVVDHVERLAGHLARECGVGPGDRVAILSGNGPELAALLLAIPRAGAVSVPLNPGAPPEDWATSIAHSATRLVFAQEDSISRVPAGGATVLPLEGVLDRGGDPLPPIPGSASAPAVILYTSGTTGQPKGVVLSQRSMIANASRMAARFGLDRTTQLAVLPLFHAHALGFGLMSALVSGGHLVVAERFDPFSWAEVIRAEGVQVTSVVPTLLRPLLDVRTRHDAVPTLERMLVSSAPLEASLARTFQERTGIALMHGWGLSEYTNFACCLPRDLTAGERRDLLFGGASASIGTPLPGTEVEVRDGDGARLPEGRTGELFVRGDGTMLSYFQDPEATRRAIDEAGWLRTGDEGRFSLHRGRPFFHVTGRIKEIIIRGGEKISPVAVEQRLLRTVPELAGKLVVLGFSHEVQGEEVGAYLEMAALPEATEQRLREALSAMTLETRPKVVLFGAMNIPRTHTGKIQRRKLQPLFSRFGSWRGAPVLANAGEAR
jgi:long-chain acyl-CoA synthetase